MAEGLTPGPAGGSPPFNFGPAPTSPGFDVADLLPIGTPQDRLRALRLRRDEARALTVPFSDISEASAARTAAANVVKRLLAPAGEGGFNLREGDSRVARERQALDKLTADFTRLTDRQAARAEAWEAAGRVLQAVETWLRDGRPGGTVLEAVEVEPPKLVKNEDVLSGIERLRRRVRELKADLHRIESAPFPSSWAKERMRAQIEVLAARGEPDASALVERGTTIFWPTTQAQVTIYNAQPGAVGYVEMPDVLAMFAWLHRDALIEQVGAAIASSADDAASLSHEERQRRTAEVEADLLAVEFQEASLVWRAMDEKLPVEFRADIAPQAVLGVALVTQPSAIDGPTTSLAYDIVLGGRR